MNINLEKLKDNGYSELQISRNFSNRIQELIILPTEKCNFRCSYCYEDFKIGKMKPWLIKSIKKFITNRVQNLDELSLSWFGGEPLLAKKICLELIKHSYDECKKNKVVLSGSFTTNGYLLTKELTEELALYNHASFQITLDGYGENHNTTRILANGKGTFETVWGNILNLKKSSIDFIITLRLHITDSNYFSMKEMVLNINKYIANDKRFNVHFHNISNLGGPNKNNIKVLNNKTYSETVNEFKNILNLSSNSELSLHKERSVCYAATPNSLLIRADGRIGKCTVAFDNPANDIGSFLPEGKIEIDNNKLKPWMYGFDSANPEILTCPATGLNEYEKTYNTRLNVNIIS